MLSTVFERVLVIAPHSDDDILGCGGMMKKVKNAGGTVHVVVTAIGNTQLYHKPEGVTVEEREREFQTALKSLGVDSGEILYKHSEKYLDTVPIVRLITAFDEKIKQYEPTAVFIPYPSFNQDHKVVFEASFAALRPKPYTKYIKLVAMYEYPLVVWDTKEMDGNRLYMDISDVIEDKVRALQYHESQIREAEHLISAHTIKVWAGRRGLEIGVPYAEAFKALKLVID